MSTESLSPIAAALYGCIQGITEFLPVSSSGHLALAHNLGLGDMSDELLLPFSLLLHVGSLIAICYAFRREVFASLRHITPVSTRNLLLSICPAIIVGLTCKDYIKEFERNPLLLMICFAVTSTILLITHKRMQQAENGILDIPLDAGGSPDSKDDKTVGSVLTRASSRQALIVGLMQATALLPGISRSGACICAALLCGMVSLEALSYAFIVGIPLIAGAAAYELVKSDDAAAMFQSIDAFPLLLGFTLSIVTGLFAIWVLRFVMVKNHLNVFAMYTAVVALVCLMTIIP